MNTDSGKSVKSVHDKTGMSVHAKTRTGVHDGPESLFTMLRNMHLSAAMLKKGVVLKDMRKHLVFTLEAPDS